MLSSHQVVLKGSLAVDCMVSGTPFPDIFWVKDGMALTESPNVQLVSGGMQLRISSAVLSDTGSYKCMVVNKAGTDILQYNISVQSICLYH